MTKGDAYRKELVKNPKVKHVIENFEELSEEEALRFYKAHINLNDSLYMAPRVLETVEEGNLSCIIDIWIEELLELAEEMGLIKCD